MGTEQKGLNMLKNIGLNVLHLGLIAFVAAVLPIEAYAAIPSLAEAAVQLMQDYAVILFGIAGLVVLDTFAWPMLTNKK
jgi:hypothetical protein